MFLLAGCSAGDDGASDPGHRGDPVETVVCAFVSDEQDIEERECPEVTDPTFGFTAACEGRVVSVNGPLEWRDDLCPYLEPDNIACFEGTLFPGCCTLGVAIGPCWLPEDLEDFR